MILRQLLQEVLDREKMYAAGVKPRPALFTQDQLGEMRRMELSIAFMRSRVLYATIDEKEDVKLYLFLIDSYAKKMRSLVRSVIGDDVPPIEIDWDTTPES